ncbi:hypothetical protein KP509_39G013300 [Ceratopteris richardii]|uniref:Uncharacterized protein n=1 Tax=Ceratopteris richardii TaxID=49495 RepID=A0A8T2PYF4_CERRI|nr:hypothetical protein KP509_39G013300 [Ceratopteris richardii]
MASIHQTEPLPLPWYCSQNQNQDLFNAALQDLRNVRPHLYAAADYYEMAYLHKNKKQTDAVVRSLQDYCVKALVTSVDHLGTVASHLDDSLSLISAEIRSMDVQIAGISRRINLFRDMAATEGVREYGKTRFRKPIFEARYDLTGKQIPYLPQLSPRTIEEIFQASSGTDSGTLKSLSWYLSFEASSSASAKCSQPKKRSSLDARDRSICNEAQLFRSLSSGQMPRMNQKKTSPFKDMVTASSSISLRSLMALDVVEQKKGINACGLPFATFFGKPRATLKSKPI